MPRALHDSDGLPVVTEVHILIMADLDPWLFILLFSLHKLISLFLLDITLTRAYSLALLEMLFECHSFP